MSSRAALRSDSSKRIPRCAVPPGLFRAHTRVASDAAEHNFTGAPPLCFPSPTILPVLLVCRTLKPTPIRDVCRATPPPVTGAVVMLWYLPEIRSGAIRGEECGVRCRKWDQRQKEKKNTEMSLCCCFCIFFIFFRTAENYCNPAKRALVTVSQNI